MIKFFLNETTKHYFSDIFSPEGNNKLPKNGNFISGLLWQTLIFVMTDDATFNL